MKFNYFALSLLVITPSIVCESESEKRKEERKQQIDNGYYTIESHESAKNNAEFLKKLKADQEQMTFKAAVQRQNEADANAQAAIAQGAWATAKMVENGWRNSWTNSAEQYKSDLNQIKTEYQAKEKASCENYASMLSAQQQSYEQARRRRRGGR